MRKLIAGAVAALALVAAAPASAHPHAAQDARIARQGQQIRALRADLRGLDRDVTCLTAALYNLHVETWQLLIGYGFFAFPNEEPLDIAFCNGGFERAPFLGRTFSTP